MDKITGVECKMLTMLAVGTPMQLILYSIQRLLDVLYV